ncbi:MAG: DUF1700 domain-containing protein [Clostridiales Family XIII bacterium]|nr:DUF1700 domain-containing protein [Clostridiales Family XIII bacterium]
MDNRKYLSQLEKRLNKLPPEDRADAIAYYAEYLDEAGPDGANIALKSLGTPAQVAAGIMADFALRDMAEGKPKVKKGISAVWFALLGVFALPIGLPVMIALFCVVFALLITVFALIFAFYGTAIGVFFGGIAVVIAGLLVIPQSFATALFYIGGGLALIGIGILLCIGVSALTRVTLKGIAKFFNALRFRKINRQARENLRAQGPGYAAEPPAPQMWNRQAAPEPQAAPEQASVTADEQEPQAAPEPDRGTANEQEPQAAHEARHEAAAPAEIVYGKGDGNDE